jgi:hypothetical protein
MYTIHPNARETILANIPKGSVGAEIGVWRGDFSAQILRTVQPGLLHLIDPWTCATDDEHANAWYGTNAITQEGMDETHSMVTKRFFTQIDAGTIQIHRLRSIDALQSFPDESLDFVYVDGDHAHDGCLADLRGSLRVVKQHGLICGDDYSLGGWWGDGIVRAVHKFVSESPVKIELVLGSQFAIRKLPADEVHQDAQEPAKTRGMFGKLGEAVSRKLG